MTVACIGHWYMSLLYLAPVGIVVAALAVVSRLEKRRETRETRTTRPDAAPRAS
jgi:cytochrome c-type biogenesis protein CcmH/NrfF